ncbi:lysophospholipase L1-like esterase [Williamsia limnetica]|uniref:Lysophospholipase L1-like esterase n=1 Tax=Williamsia limnetica TaxID=882452 RepID=A0A318RUZ0_WILLI|nr:lysophospholipase L1-like esterase [Williamsia limnetica]
MGVFVAAILAIALIAGFAWDRQRTSEMNGHEATPVHSSIADAADYPTLQIPDDPKVLFLGDSITDGSAATKKSALGFAPRLAALQGWDDYRVNGVGKSGFLSPGISEAAHRNYRDRLQEVYFTKSYSPNVIIFQAGANDADFAVSDVQAKVVETVEVARKYWPGVQIALVGPIGGAGLLSDVNRAYSRGAYEAKIPYVDALDNPIIELDERAELISDDGWHPNDAGHARIAEQLHKRLAAFSPADK